MLRGMWDLPRPGLEPVSPALAGRFSTTVPPGKPYDAFLMQFLVKLLKGVFDIGPLCDCKAKRLRLALWMPQTWG